jgi:1-acyl-sn-glycerol-3-phosphate acyltransferase
MAVIKSIIIWIAGISVLVLLFPFTFIIWLFVLPFDKNRVIIHWILVYQGMILARIFSFQKIDIEGREKIVKGTTYIIISNHQSILDTLLLYGIRYKFKWISKIENIKVPILGWYLKMADYIIVDRGNEESKAEMLEKSNRCLKNGISIMIFPEGTRSLNMEIGFFKRGAFQLAIQNGVPILPVVIDGTGGILPKHGLIFGTGPQLKIRVLEPILTSSFGTTNPDELALKISSLMSIQLKELRESDFSR